jgi:PEP-CTERM motif
MTRSWLLLGLLILAGSSMLWADTCSPTTCSLTFTESNSSSGFGSGNFGTLTLTLDGSNIDVTISLASGFFAVQTGFPGVVGFVSSQTVTGVTGLPTGYSGFTFDSTPPNSLHFDGFGDANTAVATTGPHPGSSDKVNVLSFTVDGSFTDVQQILNLFSPAGGDGPAIFVVDVFNANGSPCAVGSSCTGLIAIPSEPAPVPEPSTLVAFGSGLLGLAGFIRKKFGASRA